MSSIILTGEEDSFYSKVRSQLPGNITTETCEFAYAPLKRKIAMSEPSLVLCFKTYTSNTLVISELKDMFPDLPFVVVCEEDDESFATYAGKKPILMYKPLRTASVVNKVVNLLNSVEEESVVEKKKILAVDDDGLILRTIHKLIGNDYDMTYCTSGDKALVLIDQKPFDLILLDYEMPSMSGKDVLSLMRTTTGMKEMPVIFLTGVSDRKKVMEIVDLNPSGYLLKPIDADMLKKTIEDALA